MIVSTIVFTYLPIHQGIKAREHTLIVDLNIKNTLINSMGNLEENQILHIQDNQVRIVKNEFENYLQFCGVWKWKSRYERRVCIYDIKR